ncbi:DUF7144 family membrane protein [Actinospica robiniae]|uniref:DUF7144 family membrane protein n=1 Tax=Actinospica robiniae TaxID=304901 RepID=UPI00042A65DA|nr:hypothetical protein [Actinospica robiniae]
MASTTHRGPTDTGWRGGAPVERGSERRGTGGLAPFGGVLLLLLGFFNLLDGIAAINRSHVFVNGAVYAVGDLRSWGWTIMALGILQLLAGLGVLAGSEAARWFGVLILALNALAQMFFIPAYPFWSLLIIAIDIVAIYGLAVAGRRSAVE